MPKKLKKTKSVRGKSPRLKRSPKEPADVAAMLDAFLDGKLEGLGVPLGGRKVDLSLGKSVSWLEKVGSKQLAHVYYTKGVEKEYKKVVFTKEQMQFISPGGKHDPLRFHELLAKIIPSPPFLYDRAADISICL
jgi:hypothetical protein